MATATAQQPLMTSLYNILSANATLTSTTTIGGRIYDTLPPQDAINPFVILNIVSDPPQGYFLIDDILAEFQVDIYGKLEAGPAATRMVGDIVYGVFNRNVTLTASGYTGLSILCLDRGLAMDQDLIIGGRTQQDSTRMTQTYRLFGTGS